MCVLFFEKLFVLFNLLIDSIVLFFFTEDKIIESFSFSHACSFVNCIASSTRVADRVHISFTRALSFALPSRNTELFDHIAVANTAIAAV